MSSEDEDDKFLYSDEENTDGKGLSGVLQEGHVQKKRKLDNSAGASGNLTESSEESDEDNEAESEESDSDSDIEIIIGSGTDKSKLASEKSKISTISGPIGASEVISAATSGVSIPTEGGLSEMNSTLQPQQEQQPTIDLNPDAQYDDKPIVEIDPEILKEKPWRQPGSTLSDYFNYGFNEQTWMQYLYKQEHLRKEYNPQKVLMNLLTLQQQGRLNESDSAPVSQGSVSQPQPPSTFPPMGMPPMFGAFPPFPFPGMMNGMPNPNQNGLNNDK